MNAVEIEEAISALAELPFDAEEFPFAFLLAFGNKVTTSFHKFCPERFSRRLLAQTFARRGVEAVANRPQKSICEFRWARLAGEVTTQPIVGFLDSSILPR